MTRRTSSREDARHARNAPRDNRMQEHGEPANPYRRTSKPLCRLLDRQKMVMPVLERVHRSVTSSHATRKSNHHERIIEVTIVRTYDHGRFSRQRLRMLNMIHLGKSFVTSLLRTQKTSALPMLCTRNPSDASSSESTTFRPSNTRRGRLTTAAMCRQSIRFVL